MTVAAALPAPVNWDGMIPLRQVLDMVTPAYGGETWDEAFAFIMDSPSDAATVTELANHDAGRIHSPIRIDVMFDEDEHGNDIEVGLRVGNGMHRLTMAYLLGHEAVLCEFGDHPDARDDAYVEVYYTVPADYIDSHEDPEWFVSPEALRSFPLPDGTWVETDLMAQSNGVCKGMWLCPESSHQALLDQMRKRVPGLVVVSSRAITGAQWEAELDAALA